MKKYGGLRAALGIVLAIGLIAGTVLAEGVTSPVSRADGEAAQSSPAEKKKKNGMKIEGTTLVSCTSEESTITVPDGVKEIGPGAFEGLKTLKKVILPDSVRRIDKRAFANCTKLRTVVLTEKSKLQKIGKQAFLNCKKLDKSFVPEGVKVAEDAFEGVPEPGPTDEPGPTEEPTPTPEPDPGPGPSGGGGHSHPHAKNTVPEGPDYDLVDLTGLEDLPPMEQLTLGQETLDLTLNRKDRSGFTVSAITWQAPGGETAAESPDAPAPDTLVLTAAGGEDQRSVWTLNGALLRRMNKSGIARLVLRTGNRIAVLDTEGILGGWAYEALKSRGAGSRWFDYEIEMDGQSPAVWRVRVEDRVYELDGDIHAAIYLINGFSGTADALEHPYNMVSAGAGAPVGKP